MSVEEAPRTFLLSRYKGGIEFPLGDDKDVVMDIVMHYRHLISQRMKAKANSLPMSHFAGSIGSILFHFYAEFPSSELPLAGGITEFEFRGCEFRFSLEGARTVETINMAERLHSLDMCKPYMCVCADCYDHCAALDENLIMPPQATYFVRSGVPSQSLDQNSNFLSEIPEDLMVGDPHGGRQPADVTRFVQIIPSEFLVEQPDRSKFRGSRGAFYSEGQLWEIMPAPTDASQLDMHLAQLSSIDTKYVLRFTSEIKHMFDDMSYEKLAEGDSDEEESDPEDSYVESALIPGLQQRDFNRVIDTEVALKGLVLDTDTEKRMRAILDS